MFCVKLFHWHQNVNTKKELCQEIKSWPKYWLNVENELAVKKLRSGFKLNNQDWLTNLLKKYINWSKLIDEWNGRAHNIINYLHSCVFLKSWSNKWDAVQRCFIKINRNNNEMMYKDVSSKCMETIMKCCTKMI